LLPERARIAAGKRAGGGGRAGSDVSAYRRATWFDARREIADKWAAFLLGKQPRI